MTHELSEDTISSKIMALFKERASLNSVEIVDLLPDENPVNVKSALNRLRGNNGGAKQLRVKGYVKIVGRSGHEVPVLEVGNRPDIVKSADSIVVDDDSLKRAARVRSLQEEMRYKREMAALDW
jgi:hypothetical protein